MIGGKSAITAFANNKNTTGLQRFTGWPTCTMWLKNNNRKEFVQNMHSDFHSDIQRYTMLSWTDALLSFSKPHTYSVLWNVLYGVLALSLERITMLLLVMSHLLSTVCLLLMFHVVLEQWLVSILSCLICLNLCHVLMFHLVALMIRLVSLMIMWSACHKYTSSWRWVVFFW